VTSSGIEPAIIESKPVINSNSKTSLIIGMTAVTCVLHVSDRLPAISICDSRAMLRDNMTLIGTVVERKQRNEEATRTTAGTRK
jgi:hypothetical protein